MKKDGFCGVHTFDMKDDSYDAFKFSSKLLSDCKFIWYDIDQNGQNKDKEEDVFIRLNDGKIPLTNSELIIIKNINDDRYLILDGFDGSCSDGGEEDIYIAAERCAEKLLANEKCDGLFPLSLSEMSFNQEK